MSERAGEGLSQGSPILPDIADHSKLVDAAKRKYQSLGSVVTFGSFPKEDLDSIYQWWTQNPETQTRIARLEAVVLSGELPGLENNQLEEELKEFREKVDPVNSQIIQLTQKDKLGVNDLRPVIEKMDKAYEGADWRTQVIALGEAIVAVKDENLDEREIRVRVAQGAWEELLNSFAYAKLHYAADTGEEITTEDELEEQKAELIASLRRKPWGQRQTEKNKKVYKGLRKQIRAEEYDEEILDNLRLVWDTARGSIPQGKSALDVLSANELVLKSLYQEGAFEWDLEEIEEAGEGEEE